MALRLVDAWKKYGDQYPSISGMSLSMRITRKYPLRPWMEGFGSCVLTLVTLMEVFVERIWSIVTTCRKIWVKEKKHTSLYVVESAWKNSTEKSGRNE